MEEKTITRSENPYIVLCRFENVKLTMVDFYDNKIWVGFGHWVERYKKGVVISASLYWVEFRRIV